MKRNLQPLVGTVSLLFATFCVIALIGCVDYSGRQVGGSPRHLGGNYSAIPQSFQNTGYGYGYAGLNSSGTYHYYPRYSTYYSPQSRQYYYQRGSSWHTRTSPFGVSSRVLQSSHYVPLNIHGSPASHHSRVVQSYPSNWMPPGQSYGRYSGPNNPRRSYSRSL